MNISEFQRWLDGFVSAAELTADDLCIDSLHLIRERAAQLQYDPALLPAPPPTPPDVYRVTCSADTGRE
jgi:hypothetical protein